MRIDATVALVVAATAVVVGAVAVAVDLGDGPAEEPSASPPAALAPSTSPRPTATDEPDPAPTPTPEPDPDVVARETARAVYDGLTDAQRLGQLVMVSVYGSTIDEAHDGNQALHGVATIGEVIDRWQPGGIIYFVTQSGPTGNLEDPTQIRGLSDAIHARSDEAGVPAIIGIDQEHGRVDRLGPLATQFPGAMALGATGDPDLVRQVAAAIGTELRALGIDLDFAPVADLQSDPANPVIGTRSFGADPARVAPLLDAAITGFADAGVAATAKHFPGHGDTDVDSHTALPTIERTEAQLRSEDLIPFAAAVAADVPAVMTGHLRVPALDPSGAPATTSGPVLTGILRDELGYDGVVVTDALDMGGARETASDDALAVGALAAGADLLLMPPSTEIAVRAVADALADGRLDPQRVEEAVLRVLTLKARLGLLGDAAANNGDEVGLDAVGAPPHAGLAAEAARAAVTVVRGMCLPPAPAGARIAVIGAGGAAQGAVESLTAAGYDVVTAQEVDGAVAAARDADRALVFAADGGAADLTRQVAEVATTTSVLTDLPYAADRLAGDQVAVVYGDEPVLGAAAAALAVGDLAPTGQLPVPAAGLPIGAGERWERGCG